MAGVKTIKTIIMNLPKGYISVSQVNLWHQDRQKYINKYFMNLPDEPSIYLDFGKSFAEATETFIKEGIITPSLPHFYLHKIRPLKGMQAEKPISLNINGVNVVGFIDAWDQSGNTVIDFKTSVKPWTNDTLINSLQMKVYALAMFVNGDEIPMCQINWLGTKKTKDGITFTGESYELTHRFEMADLLQATEFIYKTAQEISHAWNIYKS